MKKGVLVLAAAAAGSLLAAVALGADESGGDGSAGTRAFHGKAALPAANEISSNWSGYVSTGLGSTASTANATTQFTNATATWKQPAATCTATGVGSASAVWVGL